MSFWGNKWRGTGFPILIAVVVLLCMFQGAGAAPKEPASASETTTVETSEQASPENKSAEARPEKLSPQQRIEQIEKDRKALAAAVADERKALENEAEGGSLEAVRKQKLDLLSRIDAVYALQIVALQNSVSITEEKRQYREAVDKLSETYGEGKSISFSELDQAREELAVQSSRKAAITAKLDQAVNLLKEAQDAVREKERVLENARIEAEKASGEGAPAERVKLAELALSLARENVVLQEIERVNQERSESAFRARIRLLKKEVRLMEQHARFTKDELNKKLHKIERDEFTFKRELARAVDQQAAAKDHLAEVRERLARAPVEQREILAEEVEAKKLADEALKTRIDNLGKNIEWVADAKRNWRRRYAVFNGLAGQAEWLKWKEETLNANEAIESDERVLNLWLSDWQNRLITIENKLGGSGRENVPVRTWLEQQQRYAQEVIGDLQAQKTLLENSRRLQQKLVHSITEKTAHRSWREWLNLMLDTEVEGNKLSDWGLTATIATSLFLLLLFVRNFVITRWQHSAEQKQTPAVAKFVASVRRTTTFFLFMISVFTAIPWLRLEPTNEQFIRNLTMVALIVQAAIWLSYFFRSWIFEYLARKTTRDHVSLGTLNIFNFLTQLSVWSLAALLVLQNIGIDVTALITGLGVGGVAVALALQRILGDVLASLSIVFDKPFVAGDFILFGENMGTVEHIGVKSTLIRSLSGEQLICPNSDLLNTHIRNFKRMRERRVVFQIGVVYQTPYDKLVRIPGIFREAVEAQKKARFDRAHFNAYGDFALMFEIVYYVLSADYNVYMDTQQAINLMIFQCFEQEGIEFAYPTQMLYLENTGMAAARPLPGMVAGGRADPNVQGRTAVLPE